MRVGDDEPSTQPVPTEKAKHNGLTQMAPCSLHSGAQPFAIRQPTCREPSKNRPSAHRSSRCRALSLELVYWHMADEMDGWPSPIAL